MFRHEADPPPEVCVLVPTDGGECLWLDPQWRQRLAGQGFEIEQARHELSDYLGHALSLSPESGIREGLELEAMAYRSATSIALATCLERAGLRWRILDPGGVPLRRWSEMVRSLRWNPPAVVGISSTFVSSGRWLRVLCNLVRRELPTSRILLGGYFYLTSKEAFLSADADVYFVGPGEQRIANVIEAMIGRGALAQIPGLYIRRDAAGLHYTGDAADPDLDDLPPPRWELADRIEPPVDTSVEALVYAVETQRGCRFRCEFCTYRELAALSHIDADRAAALVWQIGAGGRGSIVLADATATHPKARWESFLRALIARGGSPLPVRCYARVNDINDHVAELMKRAGVTYVLIGQESGDQGMLNRMRKGTRAARVGDAVRALGRHEIEAHMGFIFGFPGETAASASATRRMVLTMNRGFEQRPVVTQVILQVFRAQEAATVYTSAGLQGVDHPFGYAGRSTMSPEAAMEELIQTAVAASKVPHAPNAGLVGDERLLVGTAEDVEARAFLFRWRKTLERGVAIFVESARRGTRPSRRELEAVRDQLDRLAPRRTRLGRRWAERASVRLRKHAVAHLGREWRREQEDGRVRLLTRALLGWEAARVTRRFDDVRAALLGGRFTERVEALGTTVFDRAPEPPAVDEEAPARRVLPVVA